MGLAGFGIGISVTVISQIQGARSRATSTTMPSTEGMGRIDYHSNSGEGPSFEVITPLGAWEK